MLLSSYRRSLWRRYSKYLIYALAFLFFLDIFRLLGAYATFSRTLVANAVDHVSELPRDARNQKIYITAQFWTSEEILVEFWLAGLLKLIDTLGVENVYISIIESGSLDYSADAIRWLDQQLGELNVERSIITEPRTHLDIVNEGPLDEYGNEKSGWIFTGDSDPPGQKELRRIPYLSEVRNRGLKPLLQMHRLEGKTYDKILYLNDVYFEPSDVLTLLATNAGHYDVACGLDFHLPPAFYDTFAVRDIEGSGPVMTTFPYFRAKETRQALLQGHPARVTSCWNGMLVVDAAPYYDHVDTSTPHGTEVQPGLRFRGIPDALALKDLEASECCLIHADLIASGRAHKGIFLNPSVRSGYTVDAYKYTHRLSDGGFVSRLQYITGVWKSRFARWKVGGVTSSAGQNMRDTYRLIRQWQDEGAKLGEDRVEVGSYCTIQEMHILIWNGWKHVRNHAKQPEA